MLTHHLTEVKNVALDVWGSMMHLDEHAPPIQDFIGGGVVIALVAMPLVLLGSCVVLPGLPPTIIPPVVLLTSLCPGTSCLDYGHQHLNLLGELL